MKTGMFKKILCAGMAICSLSILTPQTALFASEMDNVAQLRQEIISGAYGADPEGTALSAGEMQEGNQRDITFSRFKVTGGNAGEDMTISFTATINSSVASRNYKVDTLKYVFANVDENSSFETNDDAAVIADFSNANATTANISYKLKVKDSVETGYAPASFTLIYSRKALDSVPAEDKAEIEEPYYYITKNFSVKLTAKSVVEKTDPELSDNDITLKVKDTPTGKYGQNCRIKFTASSSECKITNVTPVVAEGFPFETKGDAYKNIKAKGSLSVDCDFTFKVRSDVATGYSGVTFAITYLKDGKTFTTNKTINAKLQGKAENTDSPSAGGEAKLSTPRLMVTGCETSVDQIYPNDIFTLTVHMKNTAKTDVSNIKITLASDEKSFVSTNGASSAFVESIPAGETADVKFELQADSSLSAKSYGLSVKSEYEDKDVNQYTAEDTLTIPVYLKAELKLSDIQPPYDMAVGTGGTLSFSIINIGAANLYNVKATCEGADFTSEESFIGNIGVGNTGYASIMLTGAQMTEGDGECTIKVTFEDNKGNETSYTETTNIYVADMMSYDEPMTDDIITEPTQKKVVWPYIVGGVAVAGIAAACVVRSKKKRKKAVEELMDDDI